jgi:hypothetical protein
MKDIGIKFGEYLKNITIAVNYIANIIDGHNYIKDILQKEGLKVFVLGGELVDHNFNENKKNELKKTLNFIIDIMDIGYSEGVISEMNFTVFKEGIIKFISTLDTITIKETPVSKLLQNLINVQMEVDRKNAKENFIKSNIHNLDHNFVENKTVINSQESENIKLVNEGKNKIVPETKVASIIIKEGYPDINQNGKDFPDQRKKIIVNLLKDKGGQNIKDIKGHIRHVTDKTILRDITELMVEKKVFRVGEKRWAKYYIK